MADRENFCLRLNSFEENVKESWQKLQVEKDFCDVTLACEDNQIKTHKMVISSFSLVLRNILKLHQTPNPLIYLRNVKYRDLQNILAFMYQGEVDVAEEDLPGFLEVAEDLSVKGLSEGNMEGIDSNKETKSDIINTNFSPIPNIKRTVENESIENKSFKKSNISPLTHVGKAFNKCVSKQSEVTNQFVNKKSNENVVSTLTDVKLSCEICHKNFSHHGNLIRHMKSIHEGERFPCGQCNYKATQKADISRHVKSAHEGERYPGRHNPKKSQ